MPLILLQGEGEERSEHDLEPLFEDLRNQVAELREGLAGKADAEHSHPEILGALEAHAASDQEAHEGIRSELDAEVDAIEAELDDLMEALDEDLHESIGAEPEPEPTNVVPNPANPPPDEEHSGHSNMFGWG